MAQVWGMWILGFTWPGLLGAQNKMQVFQFYHAVSSKVTGSCLACSSLLERYLLNCFSWTRGGHSTLAICLKWGEWVGSEALQGSSRHPKEWTHEHHGNSWVPKTHELMSFGNPPISPLVIPWLPSYKVSTAFLAVGGGRVHCYMDVGSLVHVWF